MTAIIAFVLALAALTVNGENATFATEIVTRCTPVFEPGTFIGCEDRTPLPDDDAGYAGVIWVDGVPELETGP